jgi:hypothetical protein
MSFRLYASSAGDYLLTPECMQASREASEKLGPLTFLGCAAPSALSSGELMDVWAQLDANSFAIIEEELARSLWQSSRDN